MTLDNPLWQFSVALYERPEVAAACLAMQQSFGLSVNMLLAGVWAGSEGVRLGVDRWQALEQSDGVLAWRKQVIEPLRQLRQRLKDDAWDPEQAIRGSLLKAELQAEQVELGQLYAHLSKLLPTRQAGLQLAHTNLANYWELLDLGRPVWEDVQPLLHAAFPHERAAPRLK